MAGSTPPGGRLRVLLLTDYYLPGFRAGGPIRSTSNIVEALGSTHEFSILSRDRDLGDSEPYGDAERSWTPIGHAAVRYLPPGNSALMELWRILRRRPHDILYLNSLFSFRFSILPLILRKSGAAPRVPVIVAPRGELSPGALSIRTSKKRLFLRLAARLGLHRNVLWHATDPEERGEIRRWFGANSRVHVAPNISVEAPVVPPIAAPKVPGRLRAVFLSRIAAKKNLHHALDLLEGLDGEVTYHIFGPIEDPAYWRRCKQRAGKLSPHIRIHYAGELQHGQVAEVLASFDLFFLPTLGENFGHVILEALAAGCPVLISDQTPWRDLQAAGVGWDIPLAEDQRFRDVLRDCLLMTNETRKAFRDRAVSFAREWSAAANATERTAALFEAAGAVSPETAAADERLPPLARETTDPQQNSKTHER